VRSLIFLPVLLAPSIAFAQADVPEASEKRVTAEERPFAHLLDPSTPSAGKVSVGYSVGIGSGVAAERPLPSDPSQSIASHSVSASFGATDRIAPFATGVLDGKGGATAMGGVRFQWTDPAGPFRFTTEGAVFREGRGGAMGGFLRIASSYDLGAFRFAGNLHAERVFASGRDGIDVLALAGVSYKIVPGLRLGAEYVGQDLEDAVEQEEAEGGAKHYLGPTLAVDIDHGRTQLVAGPAFGIGQKTSKIMGRVGLVVSF
jgi:hypothetical protein